VFDEIVVVGLKGEREQEEKNKRKG